jgi:hypothetical protein
MEPPHAGMLTPTGLDEQARSGMLGRLTQALGGTDALTRFLEWNSVDER